MPLGFADGPKGDVQVSGYMPRRGEYMSIRVNTICPGIIDTSRLDDLGHQPVAGVGHQGRAGVGYQGHLPARRQGRPGFGKNQADIDAHPETPNSFKAKAGMGGGVKARNPRTLPVYGSPAPRDGAPLGHVLGAARLGPDGTLTVRLHAAPLDGVVRVLGLTPRT